MLYLCAPKEQAEKYTITFSVIEAESMNAAAKAFTDEVEDATAVVVVPFSRFTFDLQPGTWVQREQGVTR